MTRTIKTDIAIFGGGIAGLWLINVLAQRGYSCVLFETGELGSGQTLLSQGIIHGGLKYALGGTLSSESEAIAGMPDRWRASLRGDGDIDLRNVRILSETQHLWSAGSVASRFTAFFASKMLRGRIEKLPFEQYPDALRDRAFRGKVYRMDDLVVDTPSLLKALIAPVADRLLKLDLSRDVLEWNEQGLAAVTLSDVRIEPRVTVLAAGSGNDALLQQAQQQQLATHIHTQLRPLQMLMVRHRLGHRLYAHCIGASNKPRLTVTTHDLGDGSVIWYLGGDIAERGVQQDADTLVAAGKQELAQLFPWLDFSGAEFATVRVDRAEPKQDNLLKPDNAFAQRDKNLVVTWPTKLTLAPDLGDRVTALLQDMAPAPSSEAIPADLPRAQLAMPHWEHLFGAPRD